MAKKAVKKRGKPQGKKPEGTPSPGLPPPEPVIEPVLPPPVRAEVALQKRQKAQKWTGLPKQGKVKKTVSAIVALKVQGYSTNEIAEQLSLKPASVRQYLWIAGRNGWLTTQDPHEVAHSQLVHRAVSNLEEWLHARDGRTGLPDKEITLESLKGLGVFGSGERQASDSGQTNILAINITMPQGANLPTMRDGNAGGEPAYQEGEIINVSSESRKKLTE